MAAITREILRDELAYFATEIIQKEFTNFKKELMLEMLEGLGRRPVEQELQSSNAACVGGADHSSAEIAHQFQPLEVYQTHGYTPLVNEASLETDVQPTEETKAEAIHTPAEGGMLHKIAKSDWFERFILFVIMLNLCAFFIEIDYLARNWATEPPPCFFQFEVLTLLVFVFEITVRIGSDGLDFFLGYRRANNLFDLCLVALQACEVVLQLMQVESESSLNVLKMLRITRVFRAGRMISLVPALHILIASIASSLESLVWILMLVLLTVGSFAVVLTQIVTEHKVTQERDAPGQEILEEHFGTVPGSMFRLYQVMTDGFHWSELADPLMLYVTPWTGVIFVAYSAFVTFALLNVVAAVFVEAAVAEAQQDHQVHISNRLWKNFQQDLFAASDRELSEEQFTSRLETPAMQDYLRKLGMDTERAQELGLFHLLDRDHNGTISGKEILEECVRLLGYARAVDVAALRREVHVAQMECKEHRKAVDGVLQLMRRKWDFDGLEAT